MPKFDFAKARSAMVDSQIRPADVTEPAILSAFRNTPRERFVPQSAMALAHGDAVVSYGNGRYLLRPRDFAKLITAADIKPHEVVLDIGCARGYSTAILAQIAETVVGLESDEATVNRASEILIDIDVLNAAIVQGDLKEGAAQHGPFDVIMFQGAVEQVPHKWFDQLSDGGRLAVIISDGPIGRATIYTKSGGAVGDRVVFDANAPLIPGFEREPAFIF